MKIEIQAIGYVNGNKDLPSGITRLVKNGTFSQKFKISLSSGAILSSSVVDNLVDALIDLEVNRKAIKLGVLSSFFILEEPVFAVAFSNEDVIFSHGPGSSSSTESVESVCHAIEGSIRHAVSEISTDSEALLSKIKQLADEDFKSENRKAFLIGWRQRGD